MKFKLNEIRENTFRLSSIIIFGYSYTSCYSTMNVFCSIFVSFTHLIFRAISFFSRTHMISFLLRMTGHFTRMIQTSSFLANEEIKTFWMHEFLHQLTLNVIRDTSTRYIDTTLLFLLFRKLTSYFPDSNKYSNWFKCERFYTMEFI